LEDQEGWLLPHCKNRTADVTSREKSRADDGYAAWQRNFHSAIICKMTLKLAGSALTREKFSALETVWLLANLERDPHRAETSELQKRCSRKVPA
jgi:hypothetical protein